jgi:hypothetical protein
MVSNICNILHYSGATPFASHASTRHCKFTYMHCEVIGASHVSLSDRLSQEVKSLKVSWSTKVTGATSCITLVRVVG